MIPSHILVLISSTYWTWDGNQIWKQQKISSLALETDIQELINHFLKPSNFETNCSHYRAYIVYSWFWVKLAIVYLLWWWISCMIRISTARRHTLPWISTHQSGEYGPSPGIPDSHPMVGSHPSQTAWPCEGPLWLPVHQGDSQLLWCSTSAVLFSWYNASKYRPTST